MPTNDTSADQVRIVTTVPTSTNAFQVGIITGVEIPCNIMDTKNNSPGVLMCNKVFYSCRTGCISVYAQFDGTPYHLPIDHLAMMD